MERSETKRFAVGTDVGGSHVSSAVVDLTTGDICGDVLTTPVDSTCGAAALLDAWSGNIRQTIAAFPTAAVTQVGMAFPGPFDYVRGVCLICGVGKFDRIWGLNVAESLHSLLPGNGGPELRFVNDASAFALGECLGGAARDSGRVVALTLGTGVGSGFVADRRLVEHGDRVPANGWVYSLPFEEGIVDDAFSTRWVVKRYRELTGREVSGAREVAGRCDSDPAARQLFEEYGRRLADFAGPLLERFGARTLVLGGNIARAYDFFGPALNDRLAAAGYGVGTRVSSLMDRAALIGAASLFL